MLDEDLIDDSIWDCIDSILDCILMRDKDLIDDSIRDCNLMRDDDFNRRFSTGL